MHTRIALCGTALLMLAACGGPTEDSGDFGSASQMLCTPDVRTNWAGQHIDSGTVTLSNTDTDLVITVDGANGWLVDAWHLYAGSGPVPTNRAGAAAPGQFPHAGNPNPAQSSVTITLPLSSIGATCGDALNVALHTEMVKPGTSGGSQKETGWAEWDVQFAKGWGGGFPYTICCPGDEEPPPPPPDCTLYVHHWKKNSGVWPVDSLTLGDEVYSKAEMLALLDLDPLADASVYLAQHLIAARLNQASGLPVPAHIMTKLLEADAWLIAYADADGRLPYNTVAGTPEADAAALIKLWLHSYNAGYEGVPYCGDNF